MKSYIIPSITALSVAIVLALIILIIINTALMRIPVQNINKSQKIIQMGVNKEEINPELRYSAISDRNLFRTKLQIELPKPKTGQEIEEENFINAVQGFSLKGVWIGDDKGDQFAFIDKGPQKGIWIHRNGEVMEGGLTLEEIKPNSVFITKGENAAKLTLFAKGFERAEIKRNPEKQQKSTDKTAKSK